MNSHRKQRQHSFVVVALGTLQLWAGNVLAAETLCSNSGRPPSDDRIKVVRSTVYASGHTLEAILAKFSAINPQLHFRVDESLKMRCYVLIWDVGAIDELLDQLEVAEDVRIDRVDGTIVLSHR